MLKYTQKYDKYDISVVNFFSYLLIYLYLHLYLFVYILFWKKQKYNDIIGCIVFFPVKYIRCSNKQI